MNSYLHTIKKHTVCWILLAIVAAGFVPGANAKAAKAPKGSTDGVFFPPPPDEPRIQFLKAFASEKTFRGKSNRSFKRFITGESEDSKLFGKPYGVATYDHKIYICDTALSAVLVADLKTEKVNVIESKGEGALGTPLNIAIDQANGTAYVVDSTRDQVILFDNKGFYSATLGKKGEMKPRDVAISKDRLYIADAQGHNIRVYDKASREFVSEFPKGEAATNVTTGLFMPMNLALDNDGHLYVSDTGAGRVQVYDRDGKFIRSIGEMGDGLGMFARVKGIAVDREHRVYAADAMSSVTQIFNDQGKLLMYFGDVSDNPMIQILPTKVAVDYDDVSYFEKYAAKNFKVEYLVILINQLGPHKVAVYGFGHKK